MKVLVDTHVFLWSLIEPGRLSSEAAELLVDKNVECFFSAASCWEIGIKFGKGFLDLPDAPAKCVPQAIDAAGLIPLAIKPLDALHTSELPRFHSDPFDRLLIVQAKQNGMYIMTRDAVFGAYDVDLIEV